ncbi:hypothetical protein [Streptomyces platensis]|uniref:hypothetical protein n=1 Tax=Streptomyces platensis TaxID=58346 RepID=UPI003868D9B8|nr:hypothetical protein OG962_34315 [Streptomyces platensis]
MTSDDARLRQEAGRFVRWALSQKIARDHLPDRAMERPSQPMEEEARWATARRPLHDDTLKSEGRLAGLPLLLYAQGPAAFSRLTVDHIDHVEETHRAVHIRLGAVPVGLPAPISRDQAEDSRQGGGRSQPGPDGVGVGLTITRNDARRDGHRAGVHPFRPEFGVQSMRPVPQAGHGHADVGQNGGRNRRGNTRGQQRR